MKTADRVYLLHRLRDLRDWMRFIRDSVSGNLPHETGKRELLEAYFEGPFLRDLEDDAESLAERIDAMILKLESSAEPAGRASIPSR